MEGLIKELPKIEVPIHFIKIEMNKNTGDKFLKDISPLSAISAKVTGFAKTSIGIIIINNEELDNNVIRLIYNNGTKNDSTIIKVKNLNSNTLFVREYDAKWLNNNIK